MSLMRIDSHHSFQRHKHVVPQQVHWTLLTLLVVTQAQDESSEQRSNGARLLLLDTE